MSRSLEGSCAALLDLDPEPACELAGRVDTLAAALPGLPRAGLRAGTTLFDAAALALTGSRLDRLDRRHREELIDRLGRWGAAQQLLDALKVPVLLVHGTAEAARRQPVRPTSRPARPDAELDLTPSFGWPARTVADVVVIGSGAGGAMAARSLARAGLSTVILEDGRRFGVEELRQRPALDRFTSLYRDGGATMAVGRPPVLLPVGRGVGGTTLVNSGTCYRTPERVLRRWRDRHGVELADPVMFDPFLDDVESTLQVAPVPDAVMGNNGRLALTGAAALGWSAHPLRRNAPGCGGCCQCAIGCPRNAKFGVHLNALPQACVAGAHIVSDARVEQIVHSRGKATGVRARRPDGSAFEILSPWIVVAAGATETPPLLRRSGLGHHPELGRNLAIHPAVSTAGWFDRRVDATDGVLQSVGIDHFHESDGILVEATSAPPGMGSMMLPGAGRRLVSQLEHSPHLMTLGAMVGDAPAGSVRGARHAMIRYDLRPVDARRLVKSIGIMGRVLFAAGATEVLTGIRGHEQAHDVAGLDEALAHARPQRLHVAAFHPTGTARMGADPQIHPVDETGRLRGIDGVWIADASIVPSCPEVNPQVTIMALALAVVGRMTDSQGRPDSGVPTA
ncbi:MAG: GMC family oxidoreductase [Acidimicrobiales bacterium]